MSGPPLTAFFLLASFLRQHILKVQAQSSPDHMMRASQRLILHIICSLSWSIDPLLNWVQLLHGMCVMFDIYGKYLMYGVYGVYGVYGTYGMHGRYGIVWFV